MNRKFKGSFYRRDEIISGYYFWVDEIINIIDYSESSFINKGCYYSACHFANRGLLLFNSRRQINDPLHWTVNSIFKTCITRIYAGEKFVGSMVEHGDFFCFGLSYLIQLVILDLRNLYLYKPRKEVALRGTIVWVSVDVNCTFHEKKGNWKQGYLCDCLTNVSVCLQRGALRCDWWNSPAEMRYCIWLACGSQMAQVQVSSINICWLLAQFSPHFIVFIHFITIILGHLKTRNELHSTNSASAFTDSSTFCKINTSFDTSRFTWLRLS